MSTITGTIRAKAQLEPPLLTEIQNITCTLANTEYSATLPINTRAFTIRVRTGDAKLQLAFIATDSATTFLTVPIGNSYSKDDILLNGTLYFQVNEASRVVELISWY